MSDSTSNAEGRVQSANQDVRLSKRDDDTSQLERLKGKRRAAAHELTKDWPIPGYDNELWARFQVVEWRDLKETGERAQQESPAYRELLMQIDTLVEACQGMYLMKPDGKLKPLTGKAGMPVRFDTELRDLLDLRDQTDAPPKTAREIVRALFPSDVSISGIHNEVMLWMPTASKKLDEEMLGN